MNRATSQDGTSIAYYRQGSGPAVILVTGGLDDGSENAPLADELADRFTVYNYSRRGRGESGDTQPYAVKREIEDIDALIAEAGGSAHVYGVSSGGVLALEAATAGIAIDKLAVYDVPYNVAGDWPRRWQEYVEQLEALLAQGRRGDAFELFMRLPIARLATIRRPTLVATGGVREPGAAGWVLALDPAADALAASIPGAERRTIDDQAHVADPKALAPVLGRFFEA